VILTPIVLGFSLPNCAPEIIDFFREFTVHVDTLGYVCSFAVFDFRRHGNMKFGAPSFGEVDGEQNGGANWQADERLQSKDGKMEKSFLAFKAAHPEWTPMDPTGSMYLERLREIHQDMSGAHGPNKPNRHTGSRMTGSIMPGRSTTLAERSELYDRALAQSMANARQRRGIGTSLQMTSANPPTSKNPHPQVTQQEPGDQDDDRAEDGGIGSELGDSYVDDMKTRGGRVIIGPGAYQQGTTDMDRIREEEELEAEELANGGVLGLLAQIYDRKRPMI
jgi:autophagy-related protein 9